ncbi:MAG: hypothetical protein KatS3mg057_0562 [Herpetosiphonaceae bacterium]|nr:MAG: hypothetical protein KatS3mg057_0562 [Herpetosiphonaceae bacterium]
MLRQGHAELMRYFVPYNRAQSREALADAASLLLARLLFIRSLEVRGLEQQQIAPLLRGWQRIGRRRDLLSLLTGVVRTLQRLYGSPLLEPALLDQLECEPTPIEPLIEALLDPWIEQLLADPLHLALGWEAAFAQPPRPWPGETARQLIDLALPAAGKRDELPAILDLSAAGGALLVLLAHHLRETCSKSTRRLSAAPDPIELLAALHGQEADSGLRWGAYAALSLAILQSRVRLPRLPTIGTEPSSSSYDVVLLYPPSPEKGCAVLNQAQSLIRTGGALGMILPMEAAEAPAWEPLRRSLFAAWSIATAQQLDGWLILVARPEAHAERRAGSRIVINSGRRSAGTTIRQGALAALPGTPLRLELTEAVEPILARVASGRPLTEVAMVRHIRPGAPAPEHGAQAIRAALPMILITPVQEPEGWRAIISNGWPADGGFTVQPLALLAAHKGSGIRLTADKQAELEPYTLELLLALLRSRLLSLYRRLILGHSGPPTLDELRRLPIPHISSERMRERAASVTELAGGAHAEREIELLYGITMDKQTRRVA